MQRRKQARAACRVIEFLALFAGLPSLYRLGLVPIPMIPFLLLITLACAIVLLADSQFDRRRLWNAGEVRKRLPGILRLFVVCAVIVGMVVALAAPAILFSLPRRAPALWLIIMVLYPLLSVYPQELVYRTFLFHRYACVLPRPWMRIAASAGAFGFLHIVFKNELAVMMTLIGGLLFARTYETSRSTLLVSIEHALYGCLVFTIGLGAYFYGGAAR